GRRECGVRDWEARRSLDRRIRGCRRSYRGRRFASGVEGRERQGRVGSWAASKGANTPGARWFM
ncbi:hypothetical protein, partial [Thauera phenylacetica]|uniref:hypothetical protein n=1 Tax=Thauera phenylacetica TaxID=164400 RepID=UPI001B7F8AE5